MKARVEVWLRRTDPLRVHCMVVREDETTEIVEVVSVSMRGAQREMTTRLSKAGLAPRGRWQIEADSARGVETSRVFAGVGA